MSSQAKEFVAFRIPVALKEAIRELARANDRTISAEVRRALDRHVAEATPK